MKEAKFRKGEWRHDGTGWIVCGTKPICVLDTRSDTFNGDIALIAAAPKLYDSLRKAMAFIESHVGDPDMTEEMCVAFRELQESDPYKALKEARG